MLFGGLTAWFLTLVAARKKHKEGTRKHIKTSNSGKWPSGQHHSVPSFKATT
jgi:hypothetical protein